MLAILAALAAATPTPALEASTPWWEKITVTFDEKGAQKSCTYESSKMPVGGQACDDEQSTAGGPARSASGGSGAAVFSKVTYERRFSPAGKLDSGKLQPGDKLLGRQVLFLTIDTKGAIEGCKVVAQSGDKPPDYSCDDVKTETFRAMAGATDAAPRQAFMTVLVYGHTEQIA